MAMVMYSPDGNNYIAKPPPPPPPPLELKTGGVVRTSSTPASARRYDGDSRVHQHRQPQQQEDGGGGQVLDGMVLVLRAAAAVSAFVSMALVASCRHGDWMEFPRYPEYRYLLGASLVSFLYSAAQAVTDFRRMRRGGAHASSFLGFAGDQAVAYLLVTAAAAALPITVRMRSAVVNVFTDAITAAISLDLVAFAALAFSAILSACNLSTQAAHY